MRGGGLVAEVDELEGDGEFVGADCADNSLQLVAAFGGDADFASLDLGGYLEFAVTNEAGDLFGDGLFESLLYLDDLAGVAERGNVGLGFLDVFQADAGFWQLAHDDLRR